ncbi:aminoacyl-tRNA hydrolase [Patescibacteria group bacterium]
MADKETNDNRIVVIGLGNPGDEFITTRHNAGFMYIDYLLNKFKDKNVKVKKLKNSVVYEVEKNILLVKPQTFMNESGLAVKEVVKWYDVNVEEELILAHDDLDIPLGKFKLQFAKSPKDHNGILSVENHLGTTHFKRLRIGVENRGTKSISGEKYVLKKFSDEELVEIKKCFAEFFNSFLQVTPQLVP